MYGAGARRVLEVRTAAAWVVGEDAVGFAPASVRSWREALMKMVEYSEGAKMGDPMLMDQSISSVAPLQVWGCGYNN